MKPELAWCSKCNLPVFGDKCLECGGTTSIVDISAPYDPKPAFPSEVEFIKKLLNEKLGVKDADKVLVEPVLINRVYYVDSIDEVVVCGERAFRIEYDPIRDDFTIKPWKRAARLIAEEKLGYYAVLKDDFVPGSILGRNDFEEADLPEGEAYIPFTAPKTCGLIHFTEGKGYVEHVWLKEQIKEDFPEKRSITKVFEHLSYRIEELERRAIKTIEAIASHRELVAIVNFSGGKDSTAVLNLACEAGINEAILSNTGLEFPESLDFARKVSSKIGVRVYEVQADWNLFEVMLEKYGPPTRDNRWCTTVLKILPLNEFLSRKYPLADIISITGQRKYESPKRAKSGVIARSGIPGKVKYIASPILDWTALDVYAYLYLKKLEVNPLYLKGLVRVGCFMCPTMHAVDLKRVREMYPKRFSWWRSILEKHSKKKGIDSKWADYGLWRWLYNHPPHAWRIARELGVNLSRVICQNLSRTLIIRASSRKEFKVILKSQPAPTFAFLMKIMGVKVNGKSMKYRDCRAEVEDNVITVKYRWVESVQDFIKKIARAYALANRCIKCRACELICPVNCIKIENKGVSINTSKCTACGKCIEICPVAEVLAKESEAWLKHACHKIT